jgi:hypothetical protein
MSATHDAFVFRLTDQCEQNNEGHNERLLLRARDAGRILDMNGASLRELDLPGVMGPGKFRRLWGPYMRTLDEVRRGNRDWHRSGGLRGAHARFWKDPRVRALADTLGRQAYSQAITSKLTATGPTGEGVIGSKDLSDLIGIRRETLVTRWSAVLPGQTEPDLPRVPGDYVITGSGRNERRITGLYFYMSTVLEKIPWIVPDAPNGPPMLPSIEPQAT